MSDLDILDEFPPFDERPITARKKHPMRLSGDRITHCFRGHEFTAENTFINSSGGRVCRKCRRLWLLSRKPARSEASS
jgi:hypothetical protein